MDFDESKLDFVQIEQSNLPGLGIGNFGLNQTSNGKITFSWQESTLQGYSMLDNSPLFAIRFHIIADSTDSTFVSFSNQPTLIEAVDNNFNTLQVNTSSGLILLDQMLLNIVHLSDTFFCEQEIVEVHYESNTQFANNNEFQVLLSDEWGDFTNFTSIGSLSATDSVGIINATIPAGLVKSNQYKIKLSANQPIISSPPYSQDLTINSINPQIIQIGSELIAQHTSETNTNYQWINCANSTSILGANNPNYTPVQNGSYAIEITEAPCTSTTECIEVIDVGLNLSDETQINIFPSPFSHYLRIQVDQNIIFKHYTISDISGRIVVKGVFENAENLINTHALNRGLYFLSINGQSLYKLIKM
jgi:hypothetical protein